MKRNRVELFGLARDRPEKHNLSAEQPERLRSLGTYCDPIAAAAVALKQTLKPADYRVPVARGEQP